MRMTQAVLRCAIDRLRGRSQQTNGQQDERGHGRQIEKLKEMLRQLEVKLEHEAALKAFESFLSIFNILTWEARSG